ncbi:hypothetical protein G7Y79_00046g082090 [Physcia stellaris]|nr:hypothetical protein G7Y79_00046g082090 [Physcia stellaris]
MSPRGNPFIHSTLTVFDLIPPAKNIATPSHTFLQLLTSSSRKQIHDTTWNHGRRLRSYPAYRWRISIYRIGFTAPPQPGHLFRPLYVLVLFKSNIADYSSELAAILVQNVSKYSGALTIKPTYKQRSPASIGHFLDIGSESTVRDCWIRDPVEENLKRRDGFGAVATGGFEADEVDLICALDDG